MRLILHAVVLVVLGLLPPVGRADSRHATPAGGPTWSGETPAHQDTSGGSAPRAWLLEPGPPAGGSPPRPGTDRGPAAPPARAQASRGSCAVRGARAPRAFAPGELPAAQAFLRVNGSADGRGARA